MWKGERIADALDRAPPAARPPGAPVRGAVGAERIVPFSLFGVPLAVRCNDVAVRAALAGLCDADTVTREHGAGRIALTLLVDPAMTGAAMTAPPHVDGPHLTIDGPGFATRADATRSRGWCRLSPGLCDDAARLREAVLEPLLLFLVARHGRAPLHAAGFVADGLALLLAGPSGAGKSCLTLAAQRAGFTPLSDDTVFVEAGPEPRVWGLPGPIHLFPDDAPADGGAVRLRNGKLKQAVAIDGARAPRHADAALLCLLRFGDTVALAPLDPDEAMRALAMLEPGFDLLGDEIAAAVAALVRRGAWSLTLSDRPDDAVALLAANLPMLRGTMR